MQNTCFNVHYPNMQSTELNNFSSMELTLSAL
jgi:hypothetical protein